MDHSEREKIDRYLLNKMDDSSRLVFEQRMASDKELAKKVTLAQEAFQLLDALGDQKMKMRMDQIHDNVIGKIKRRNRTKTILALLTGFLIILGFVYYFMVYKSNINSDPAIIYAQYIESYHISLVSREEGVDLELQQVNALYKNKEYQKALPILDNLIAKSSDTKLHIAAGISALQTGNYEKALSHFNFLIDNNDPLYGNQARWYAALTALQSENTSLAKQYLQSLIDSGASYKKQESLDILRLLE